MRGRRRVGPDMSEPLVKAQNFRAVLFSPRDSQSWLRTEALELSRWVILADLMTAPCEHDSPRRFTQIVRRRRVDKSLSDTLAGGSDDKCEVKSGCPRLVVRGWVAGFPIPIKAWLIR